MVLVEGMNSALRSVIAAFLLVALRLQLADAGAGSWNYKPGDDGGPENWHLKYPDCTGVMQSPINIDTSLVLLDPNLVLFDFSDYSITDGVEMELENVGGHTAEVLFSGKDIFLKGGSLPDKYRLDQFHFHWGSNSSQGSEHKFNGQHFPMEVHFVHKQSGLNTSAAASHPFGLAVIGFFFQVGKKNENYEILLQHFNNISEADQKVTIPTFPIRKLLPQSDRIDYFRYHGSLTTPPCFETVTWSVATDFIEISEEQLKKFRNLFDEEKHQLVDDFRPVQKLNRRTVLTTSLLYRQKGSGAGILSTKISTHLVVFLYILIPLL